MTLTKAVLTSTATYHLSVINIPKWVRAKLDKISRGFIWVTTVRLLGAVMR